MLACFARQTLKDGAQLNAPTKGVPDADWAQRFLKEYRAVTGTLADIDSTERALKDGMDGEYFSQRKSKLERRLKSALGPAAMHYLINDGGTRPRKYRLMLPPESVKFAENVAFREEPK